MAEAVFTFTHHIETLKLNAYCITDTQTHRKNPLRRRHQIQNSETSSSIIYYYLIMYTVTISLIYKPYKIDIELVPKRRLIHLKSYLLVKFSILMYN